MEEKYKKDLILIEETLYPTWGKSSKYTKKVIDFLNEMNKKINELEKL